jgi:membrane protease YdiL (CAAX protease family)
MFLRVTVFYVLTWFFLMLLGGIQQATGILPPQVGLPQWAPGAAALLMLVIFRQDGFKLAFFSTNTPKRRYLYAALIPAGVGLLVFLVRSLIPMASSIPDIYNQMLLVLIWTPVGALGEELGWRGYLHKKLDTRMRGLFSAVLVGLLWMLIHVTFLTQGPVFLFFMALWFISLSIVVYALVQDTGFSVLLATLFHLSINFINLLIIDVMYETSFWVVNGSIWAIVAAVTVFAKRDLFLAAKGSA